MRARAAFPVLGLLVVLCVGAVSLHVAAYRQLSPVDEMQHVDQIIEVSHFRLVRDGDRVGQEAMREAACRGIDWSYELPACGLDRYDPEDFPERGFNTASVQFPVYYAITGFPARALTAVTPIDSVVTSARLMGAFWLAAGLGVVWLLAGELGASRRARIATLGLFASTPLLLTTSSVVNPDAALLFSSGLVVLLGLRFERGRSSAAVLVGVAICSQVLEPTNVFVVVLVGAFLVVRAWQRADRRQAAIGLAIVVGAFVAAYGLPQLRGVLIGGVDTADELPMFQNTKVATLTLDDLLGEFGATVAPVTRPFVPLVLRDRTITATISVLTWFTIATVFGSAFWSVDRRTRALGVATAVLMIGIGPIVALHYWVGSGSIIATPTRYGLPLMAPAMALGAVALTRRSTLVATGAVAAIAGAAVLTRLAVGALGG